MKARLRLASENGYTLTELVMVVAILGVVLGGLSQLFLSATNSQIDQTNRFGAQQNGRLALDTLRREIHCANAVSSTQTGVGWPSTAVKINLGSYCTTGSGDVTWCTSFVSTARYALRRVTPALAVGATCAGGIVKADYLTTSQAFTYTLLSGSRPVLNIDLPVDVKPATTPTVQVRCSVSGLPAQSCYELKDDIVLRNAARA